jgi:hypothetical protein
MRHALAAVALASAAALTPALADAVTTGTPPLQVVAKNLDNPRKIFVGAHGELYVAEAGAGGRDRCLGTGPGRTCVGLTGSIMRVAPGGQERVVVGLMSVAGLDEQRAEGPSSVVVEHGTYYVLMQDAYLTPRGTNTLGPDGAAAGKLISTPSGRAVPSVVADLAAFEARRNPDRGAGPGAALGSPAIDSDPYAVVRYRRGFAVADAAANDLLWISPKGKISVLAVFPTRTEQLDKADRKAFGLPADVTSISVQSVPSSLAVGPDGALYVGELTGLPFRPGTARIWRVEPGGSKSLYGSGFTTISDLAFHGRDLLVLELASTGVTSGSFHGALVGLAPDGRRRVVVDSGLVAPTGLAIANGSIYISNYGTYPGVGSGPHGELVRLPA